MVWIQYVSSSDVPAGLFKTVFNTFAFFAFTFAVAFGVASSDVPAGLLKTDFGVAGWVLIVAFAFAFAFVFALASGISTFTFAFAFAFGDPPSHMHAPESQNNSLNIQHKERCTTQ